MTRGTPVFVARASSAPESKPGRSAIRKLNIVGSILVVAFVGCIGGWAATSELAGAVIATGTLTVKSNVKKVQHPTGGVVKELLVREGSTVTEGQILVRLDDTVTRATLGVVRSQLDESNARHARLIAEREDADTVTFSQDLVARAGESNFADAIHGEQKLFESRRAARAGQRSQLRERISQSNEEVRGLTAQQQAKEGEIKLISEELVGVADLYKKSLVSISRYMQLQRERTRLEGDRGQFIAEIARARARISETELQIIQLDEDFRGGVLKDIRETQGKIAELVERMVAAEDQLKRVDIRAPHAGIVNLLTVHTVGGVIGNGETIMQIVPQGEELIVEVKVAPQDIDQIEVGGQAAVRLVAGNQRTMPELNGVVTLVSADLTREQTGAGATSAHYLVHTSLPQDEVARLGEFRLVPGMSAEVFIQTYARTPLQYLIKPLRDQIARTFRER